MKNKAKMAFEMLEAEMEVIHRSEQVGLKAGTGPVVITMYRFASGTDYTASYYSATSNVGNIHGYMLEPGGPSTITTGVDQRIPAGTYNLSTNITSHGMYELYNDSVGTNRHIKIHAGNSGADTAGCLLPGSSYSNGTVSNSRNETAEINAFIMLNGGPGNVVIKIVDLPTGSTGFESTAPEGLNSTGIIGDGFDDIGYFQVYKNTLGFSGLVHPLYGNAASTGVSWAGIPTSNIVTTGIDDVGTFINFQYQDSSGNWSTGFKHTLVAVESTGNGA